MSAIVETSYCREIKVSATDYHVDEHGNLCLDTSLCTPVAVFAAGKWLSVTFAQERGPDGRFVKRGNR